jgi:hypothetical protein
MGHALLVRASAACGLLMRRPPPEMVEYYQQQAILHYNLAIKRSPQAVVACFWTENMTKRSARAKLSGSETGWYVVIIIGPEDIDPELHAAFANIMAKLAVQCVRVHGNALTAPLGQHFRCHERGSKTRKSIDLVRIIWQALFKLCINDENAWLVADHPSKKTEMDNGMASSPFAIQCFLNANGFQDLTTDIYLNASIVISQGEWRKYFLGLQSCARALHSLQLHSRALGVNPGSFAAFLVFDFGLGCSAEEIAEALEFNEMTSEYVYYE